jgi:hypothetical protein
VQVGRTAADGIVRTLLLYPSRLALRCDAAIVDYGQAIRLDAANARAYVSRAETCILSCGS